MGTNMTGNGAERKLAELAEEVLRLQKLNAELGSGQAIAVEPAPPPPPEPEPEPALAPLVDRIAVGFAKSLVMALKELENHIAAETRKVGDSLGRRLDALQASLSEQRSMSLSVQDQCRDLAAETMSLRESDARQDAEIAALRATVTERIDGMCKELSVQQEDIAELKSTLNGLTSRADGLLERLDRQAETLRSMCGTYAQRETELEQLVEGLARLRAFPAPQPTQGL